MVSVLISFDDLAGNVIPGVPNRVQDADDWVVRFVSMVERVFMEGCGGKMGRLMGLTESWGGRGKVTGRGEDKKKVIFGRGVPKVEII